MFLVGQIKTVERDGALPWHRLFQKVVGHRRRTVSYWMLSKNIVQSAYVPVPPRGGSDYRRLSRWSVVASLVETRNSGRESLKIRYRGDFINVDSCRMRKTLARHVEPRYRPEVSETSYRTLTFTEFTFISAWSSEEVWPNARQTKRDWIHCFKYRMRSY